MKAFSILFQLLLVYCSASDAYSCPGLSIEGSIYNGQHRQCGRGLQTQDVYDDLIRCPDIRSLSLRFVNERASDDLSPVVPFRFEFKPNMTLPSLRELRLQNYDFYAFDYYKSPSETTQSESWMNSVRARRAGDGITRKEEQCAALPSMNVLKWKDAMDWTTLEVLELGEVDTAFFDVMNGELPALKSLKLNRSRGGWGNFTEFLTSLNPLTSLSMQKLNQPVRWPEVLDRHSKSLNTLEIRDWWASKPPPHAISLDDIKHACNPCPNLTYVSFSVDVRTTSYDQLIDTFAGIASLTNLHLWFRSEMQVLDLSNTHDHVYFKEQLSARSDKEQEQALNLYIANKSILRLFKDLISAKRGVPLQNLTISFEDSHPWKRLPSKFTCNLFNEAGFKKEEGEPWCLGK